MPQIWLDHQEIADLCHSGDVGAAAAQVIQQAWPRRRCRDGIIRVKLPPDQWPLFFQFYGHTASQDEQTTELVSALRTLQKSAGGVAESSRKKTA